MAHEDHQPWPSIRGSCSRPLKSKKLPLDASLFTYFGCCLGSGFSRLHWLLNARRGGPDRCGPSYPAHVLCNCNEVAPILHQSPLEATDWISVRSFRVYHPFLQSYCSWVGRHNKLTFWRKNHVSNRDTTGWDQRAHFDYTVEMMSTLHCAYKASSVSPSFKDGVLLFPNIEAVSLHWWNPQSELSNSFQVVSFWCTTRTDHLITTAADRHTGGIRVIIILWFKRFQFIIRQGKEKIN